MRSHTMHTYMARGNWLTGKYGKLFKVTNENIQGLTPMDAAEKRFNRRFKRVREENSDDADLYLMEATYDPKTGHITPWGRGCEFSYKVIPG